MKNEQNLIYEIINYIEYRTDTWESGNEQLYTRNVRRDIKTTYVIQRVRT